MRVTRVVGSVVVAVVVVAAMGYWIFLRGVVVETVPVASGTVPVIVQGPGTVQARVPVTLSARITATVVELHADQGSAVRKGDLLAMLDDRELAAKRSAASQSQETVRRNVEASEAAVAKARADLELARAKYHRDQELFEVGYISRAALDSSIAGLRAADAGLDNAEALLAARRSEGRGVEQETRYAETVLSHTRIVAPMDGIVIQRLIEVGATVVPGTAIFKLVDPATVWVTARIDESVVGRLAPGLPAQIRLRTGEEVAGKVARIAHQADAATRELEVDVAFDAPLARFAIDQEAQVSIEAGEERGVVVPVSALLNAKGGQTVLVLRDGRAVSQAVQTGASDGKRVVVRSGITVGEPVLVKPQGVKPGMRARAAD
jgi:RND family efflux transporter MFP subunit